jgi:uncharacterized protein
LRAVLEHNRDEEKEHAAMALEWLRRIDPVLDRHLRTFAFSEGPITEIEKEAKRTLLAARRVVDFKGPLGCGASSRWSSCASPSR